jgi:hypothetical protein
MATKYEYQMVTKYTKWPQNIPNDRKIDQMAIKYTNIARPSKIYPNWDFWLQNMPSGNPAREHSKGSRVSLAETIFSEKLVSESFCVKTFQSEHVWSKKSNITSITNPIVI